MSGGQAPVRRRNRPYAARLTPERRQTQLLDAALEIIVREGIHKVSMDSVAKEAGVTRPVVYGQFADTPSLQRASLEREEQAALSQIDSIRRETDELPLVQGMLAYLDLFLTAVQSAPQRWQAIFLLVDSSTPEMQAKLESARQGIISAFERRIRRGDADTPPITDVEMLARTVYALMWDAGRLVIDEHDAYSADRIVSFARMALPALVTSVHGVNEDS